MDRDLNELLQDSSSANVLDEINDHFWKLMSTKTTSAIGHLQDDGWLPSVAVFDVSRMLLVSPRKQLVAMIFLPYIITSLQLFSLNQFIIC